MDRHFASFQTSTIILALQHVRPICRFLDARQKNDQLIREIRLLDGPYDGRVDVVVAAVTTARLDKWMLSGGALPVRGLWCLGPHAGWLPHPVILRSLKTCVKPSP